MTYPCFTTWSPSTLLQLPNKANHKGSNKLLVFLAGTKRHRHHHIHNYQCAKKTNCHACTSVQQHDAQLTSACIAAGSWLDKQPIHVLSCLPLPQNMHLCPLQQQMPTSMQLWHHMLAT
jgi:hypothetical protein